MATVLIKGDPDVGRFAIVQHSTGNLRAGSPCCSRSMDELGEGSAICRGCKKDWAMFSPGAYQICGEVLVIPGDDMALRSLRDWAVALTGYETLELSVSS